MVAAFLLGRGHEHDLNMRGAWLHVISDLLGSVTAIAAGILIVMFGWLWADPVCSVLISVIIIASSWKLVIDSVNILLVGTPVHIKLAEVESTIMTTDGVRGVHDLHVWTIAPGREALSAHINHDPGFRSADLLASVRERLHSTFGIDHLTIQMETLQNETEAIYVCDTGTKCFEPTQIR
jgi:cobalt-zinc-cadmium efflux system protein